MQIIPGEKARGDFPIFRERPSLAYLDSAATAQKPYSVIYAMEDFLVRYNAPVHRALYPLGEEATKLYENSRNTLRDFFGWGEDLIFTRNATAAINLVARSWGDSSLKEGDQIVLLEMEHHSNIVPWQMLAERVGATINWVPTTPDGEVDQEAWHAALDKNPKIVAFTHISNVLGTRNPAREMAEEARRAGAMTLVDGTQAAPRREPLPGSDFYVASGHKMFGPTGIGLLLARRDILGRMEPLEGGGGMISQVSKEGSAWAEGYRKFEAGTPPLAEAVGLAAAARWISGIEGAGEHEESLSRQAREGLGERGAEIYGQGEGIVSFHLPGIHPHDAAEILGREDICVRAGHHCAQVLLRSLGKPALLRASFAPYNTKEDVRRMLGGIDRCQEIFKIL